jgi:hypothetical protein
MNNSLSLSHHITRLVFDVGQPYEKFRGRYEATVPAQDPRWPGPAGRHVRPPADASAGEPPSFFLYWRANLAASGEPRPCTVYLMGSHLAVEKVGPAVMLDSLLRSMIYIDSDDKTRFAVDRPSSLLRGFADPAIARLGTELDHQLAELLETLGIDATTKARRVMTGG